MIVDEADSVLTDDGVTPLLISGESKNKELKAFSVANLADRLIEGKDYLCDEKFRTIKLKDSGEQKLNQMAQNEVALVAKVRRKELLNQAPLPNIFLQTSNI